METSLPRDQAKLLSTSQKPSSGGKVIEQQEQDVATIEDDIEEDIKEFEDD